MQGLCRQIIVVLVFERILAAKISQQIALVQTMTRRYKMGYRSKIRVVTTFEGFKAIREIALKLQKRIESQVLYFFFLLLEQRKSFMIIAPPGKIVSVLALIGSSGVIIINMYLCLWILLKQQMNKVLIGNLLESERNSKIQKILVLIIFMIAILQLLYILMVILAIAITISKLLFIVTNSNDFQFYESICVLDLLEIEVLYIRICYNNNLFMNQKR